MALSQKTGAPSKLGRILRTIFWALLFAFVFGFVIGTLLRKELEQPVRYIGERSDPGSALASTPSDIGDTQPRVLVPCDHEEQV